MESRKQTAPASKDKTKIEKVKPASKCKCRTEKKKKEANVKEELQEREKLKISQIPVLKCEKIDLKSIMKDQQQPRENTPSKAPCSCPCLKQDKNRDYELRLKTLEEKEKSIAEYYLKIEDAVQRLMIQNDQKQNGEQGEDEKLQNSLARKMISDPEVFRKNKWQNKILSDFENNVEEISSIWLNTSADLFNTLTNLKKNPILDPMEFEIENERIQVAIKQAKSLTLLKTRSVIAEAKKLYHHGELIRTELEKLISVEGLKFERGMCSCPRGDVKEGDGTGDSTKQSLAENAEETIKMGNDKEDAEELPMNSGETMEKPLDLNQFGGTPSEIMAVEMETLATELAKKNETITGLNNKIFELQKACGEHLLKYNQLQNVLADLQDKIQWNQVLWKQIGKLKERILGLQQSNKQLEANKKELENKITKLDKELERLIKLNHLLNQRKHLTDSQECTTNTCGMRVAEVECRETEEKKCSGNENCIDFDDEKIISDKQNAINQLKAVLNAMRDQENFAQKQIAMFQSKIEALERKS